LIDFRHLVPFCQLLFACRKSTMGPMLGAIFITLLVIGFFAFLAVAPQETIQITLVLVWGLMLLSAVISPFLGY
jgi:hypothetical membrane protein